MVIFEKFLSENPNFLQNFAMGKLWIGGKFWLENSGFELILRKLLFVSGPTVP